MSSADRFDFERLIRIDLLLFFFRKDKGKKDDESSDDEDKFEKLKEYDNWTSHDYMELVGKYEWLMVFISIFVWQ